MVAKRESFGGHSNMNFRIAAYFLCQPCSGRHAGGDFKMMAIQERMVGSMRSIRIGSWPFFVIRDTVRVRLHDPLPRLKPLSATSAGCCPKPLPRRLLPRHLLRCGGAGGDGHWQKLAHGPVRVSLMAGQGASLALAGGRTLGQVLDGEADIAAAMARFEQRLRSLVLEKQRAGRRMAK
jgi:hypothetical protein